MIKVYSNFEKNVNMKNLLLLAFTSVFVGSIYAQVPSNRTVYDCANTSKNIYSTLATGKSVIILHKGVDCSICRGAASGWQTWAAANTSNVEVWGAITYTYSGSAFPVANICTLTNNWVSTYGWNDIFTFPDSNRLWVQAGSPRYYVYSAIDSSIVYQGPSSSIARNTAIAQSTVGINRSILEDAQVYSYNGELIINNLPNEIKALKIFNANAQLIVEKETQANNQIINLSNYGKGVYIIQFISPKGIESKKLIF
ncbi:MAG: hypothetical protein ACJASF_001262 [Vicingaceae bacterium]